MARESIRRGIKMRSAEARSEYVGAFTGDGRLTLVAIDPSEPWEAFKQLRRKARREGVLPESEMGLYRTEEPIEHTAEVISLEARRQAG